MKLYQFKVYDEKLENYLNMKMNFSDFVRELLTDKMNGKLEPVGDIDFKLKSAKLLKDTLSNWREIKLNGEIDFEEAKKLLAAKTELKPPQLIINNDGHLESDFCSGCGHMHTSTHPKVCLDKPCNCEVRH